MQGSTAEFVVLQMCFKEQWTPDPIISSVNLNSRKSQQGTRSLRRDGKGLRIDTAS